MLQQQVPQQNARTLRFCSPDPAMHHVLKILSGSLSGVEYTLSAVETVFHVGPREELVNGNAARLLGQSDNAYYIPADIPVDAFTLRIVDAGTTVQLELGERNGTEGWLWREATLQVPLAVAGLHVALRRHEDTWSEAVTCFTPPPAPSAVARTDAVPPPPPPRRRGPALMIASVAVAVVALCAGWFYWHYLPETRIRGLAGILQDAPADYQIVAGAHDRLYVFADTPADRTWAERASRRLQRRGDVHLVRHDQARRLEQVLLDAGLDVVVVRLDEPARPHVVLAGARPGLQTERVRQALRTAVPWQHEPQVDAITDQQLIAQARLALRVRGISSRAEPDGTRTSIVNDVFLDDMALGHMTNTAAAFHRQWGTRRIAITPRLWDDLLQGRSYRYTPGQLLSIGSGRWDYAGAAGSAAPASP